MKNFFDNWNYKKHALTVSCIYLGVALIGNSALGKPVPKEEKSLNPVEICKKTTKKQWIFNGILTSLYSIDMSLTYVIINHFKKQYK